MIDTANEHTNVKHKTHLHHVCLFGTTKDIDAVDERCSNVFMSVSENNTRRLAKWMFVSQVVPHHDCSFA